MDLVIQMIGNRDDNTGVKNKFRQVLLIEGRPAPLYVDSTRTRVSVIVDGETHRLGYMSQVMVDLLRRIPGAKVETTVVNSPKTVGLKTVRGLHIRKAKENTTIEVSAPTEEALARKIEKVTTELEVGGTKVTERCSWVCITDKAHPELYPTDKVQDDNIPLGIALFPADGVPPFLTSTKKKSSPGRHGPGIPPAKRESTQAAKEKIKSLRELAIKKGLVGTIPNTPPADIEMHGD